MKKIVVTFLVASSALFTACDENSILPQSEAITSFDFASTEDTTSYENRKGKRPKLTPVEVADLSSTISSYISNNYTDAVIDRAGTDSLGNFIVKISIGENEHKGLLFDSSGAFVEELAKPEGGKGGGDRPQLTAIEITDLPTEVSNYLNTNYANAEIKKAGSDEEGNIHIGLLNGESKLILIFDSEGTFLKEMTPPARKQR